MSYICKQCNKIYKSYKSLWTHNKTFHKSTKMIISLDDKHTSAENVYHEELMETIRYECNNCKKPFSHYQSRWRHEKKCKQNNQINELKEEIKELKNIVQMSKETTKNINFTNCNINTGTAINNNININTFNNDNLSFLSQEFITDILKDLKIGDEHYLIIPKVLNEIKFNKDHPENHNVVMTSFRSKYGKALGQNGWVFVEANELIDKLANRGFQIIKKISNENPDKMKGVIPECYEVFKDNFLCGTFKNDMISKVKEVTIIGTKNLTKKSLKELEEELDKEIEL